MRREAKGGVRGRGRGRCSGDAENGQESCTVQASMLRNLCVFSEKDVLKMTIIKCNKQNVLSA